MSLLQLRIRIGDLWARLAQAESELPEETLALSNSQFHSLFPLDPSAQCFAIPKCRSQIYVTGRSAQDTVHLLQLFRRESHWPPWPVALCQTSQALILEALHPILYGSWRISKQSRHLWATHSLRNQQNAMETVIISRFFRPTDLIL
jgi:hypothetical protein